MPTLEWIGKEKVINHDKEVPFKLLDAQYTFDEKGKREGEADSGNMIIHGDNLLALKALLPKYQGKIKCIYIDPPYNTGNEGWVYNDKVSDPQMAIVDAAKVMVCSAIDLLANGAEKALEIKKNWKAPMTKEEYLSKWCGL